VEFAAVEKLQGIYNLVNKEPQSSRDLLDRLSEQHDLPKVMWNPSEQQVRPYNSRVSNQKLEAAGYKFIRKCGWKPRPSTKCRTALHQT
jgi:dTDP-4-dehydrorhamnose reductase